jgi:hypothetical protein
MTARPSRTRSTRIALRQAQAQPAPGRVSSQYRSLYPILPDSNKYPEELILPQRKSAIPRRRRLRCCTTDPAPSSTSTPKTCLVRPSFFILDVTAPPAARLSLWPTTVLSARPRNIPPSSVSRCPSRHIHLGDSHKPEIWSCAANTMAYLSVV